MPDEVNQEQQPRRMFGIGKRKKESAAEEPKIPSPPEPIEAPQEEETSIKEVMMEYYKEIDELRLNYIKLMGFLEGKGLM